MKPLSLAAISIATFTLTVTARAIEPNKADPLYRSKGDQRRTYKFPATGQTTPYRIYVPTTWSPDKKLPLILVLHGGGLDENAPFERSPAPMKNELQKMAEEFNFIIASPSGLGASFGAPPPPGLATPPAGSRPPRPAGAPAGPPPMVPSNSDPQALANSEQDVMNVVELMEKEYNVDTAREFITGNSMGGIGTMYLAAKYPDKWLAMAPSEAGFQPERYGDKNYGVKGALFIHKEDPRAPSVETASAEIVKLFSSRGIDAHTISVPNTLHENVWFFTLPTTFHFFDKFANPK